MKTKYMHTLYGRPAFYVEGEQIVDGGKTVSRLEDSLKIIRKQQKLSEEWRRKRGLTPSIDDYGYVIVKIK